MNGLLSTQSSQPGSCNQKIFTNKLLSKIIASVFCLVLFVTTYAQEDTLYYNKGIEKLQSRRFEEAIKLFDKAIEFNPALSVAWVDRGYAKNNLKLFEAALTDFNEAIKINPAYKRAWLNRGVTKYGLVDYNGALADYDQAIALDTNYAGAYVGRGIINEKLGKKDATCADYKMAFQLGNTTVKEKVDQCNGKTADSTNKTNAVVLDEEKKKPNLTASFLPLGKKNKDTSAAMLFILSVFKLNTAIVDSLNNKTVEDPLSYIEIILKNGANIQLKNARHGQLIVMGKVISLMFIAIFNQEQKELLVQNDIQKISFQSGDDQYEYNLKDKYAGGIKGILNTASNK